MSESQTTIVEPAQDAPQAGAAGPATTTPAQEPTQVQLTPSQANRLRDGMTDARLASARAAWVGAGLDVKLFDAEYGVTGQGTAPANTAEPQISTPPAETVALPAVTPEQAQQIEVTMLAAGKTEAEIAAELARLGMVEDTRSEAQIEHDRRFMLDTPRDPSQYKLDMRAMGLIGRPITEVAEAQTTWGEFLAAAQVDAPVGVGLVEYMSQTSRTVAAMPEFERDLWVQQQAHDLLRHAGSPEAVQQIKNDAGFAISWAWDHAADKTAVAKVVEGLGQSGMSKSAFVLRMLASVGKNLREWVTTRPD
jgi:hypothetical protein